MCGFWSGRICRRIRPPFILRQDSAESTSTLSVEFLFPSQPPDICVIILAVIIHTSGERDYFQPSLLVCHSLNYYSVKLVAYLMACIFILYQVYICIFTGLISSSNSKMYITKSANIRLSEYIIFCHVSYLLISS